MSAIDQCEPEVIRALQKEGWAVLENPYTLNYSATRNPLFADLHLEHLAQNLRAIVVEVKCFGNPQTYIGDLYSAIGQYIVYRAVMDYKNIPDKLYIAIPSTMYATLISEPALHLAWQRAIIHFIVVDLAQEEVGLWQH